MHVKAGDYKKCLNLSVTRPHTLAEHGTNMVYCNVESQYAPKCPTKLHPVTIPRVCEHHYRIHRRSGRLVRRAVLKAPFRTIRIARKVIIAPLAIEIIMLAKRHVDP